MDGVAFSERADGDLKSDHRARAAFSSELGISTSWGVTHQVHGADVVTVDQPGEAGDADAIWTTTRGLPVAVFTADCFGVVLQGDGAVGVAHAGWRGAGSGVVTKVRSLMTHAGHPPQRAAIGPGIGSCCFEVGPDVESRFEGHVTETSWGTSSVDLAGVLQSQLEGLEVWWVGGCTMHESRWFSHRDDATPERMAAVGWL
jgi:hypothetical protein